MTYAPGESSVRPPSPGWPHRTPPARASPFPPPLELAGAIVQPGLTVDDDPGVVGSQPLPLVEVVVGVTTLGQPRPMSLLAAGQDALAKGEWEAARARFQEVLQDVESPEALEGLGRACWWLDDVAALFAARQRAFRLYRDRGDDLGAARVALHLAEDSLLFRDEPAVFNGWMERAKRLLGSSAPSPEHALLAVQEALYAVLMGDDPCAAGQHAKDAIEIAARFQLFDLEMLARSLEGVALVSEGEVSGGMRRLDEATAAATGGEMRDIELIALTCCCMITACELTRDVDRAAQWCLRVQEFCERHGLGSLFAICRAYYASVLTARGQWTEAEQELLGARAQLDARPPQAAEAVLRLAELRRRQGRLDEAQVLLEKVEPLPGAQAVLAALALDRGDPARALEAADRFLRQVAERDRTRRAHGLELLVRTKIAAGELDAAPALVEELRELAGTIGTPLLQASAANAEGSVAAASGAPESARACLQTAIAVYEQQRLTFEAAESLLALSEVQRTLGAQELAIAAAERSLGHGTRLGAALVTARAAALLAALKKGSTPPRPLLTPREREVLGLIAEGLGDRQIARRLVLSEHTVHRHVSNILTKLSVPSRAAAIARAAADGLF
jgi:LuxR family transcriptional regulator, maltose regulon positive regulatory protein